MSHHEQLTRNLRDIATDIRRAAAKAGRDGSLVRLVAVTKYAEWPWVQELSQLHQILGRIDRNSSPNDRPCCRPRNGISSVSCSETRSDWPCSMRR